MKIEQYQTIITVAVNVDLAFLEHNSFFEKETKANVV